MQEQQLNKQQPQPRDIVGIPATALAPRTAFIFNDLN